MKRKDALNLLDKLVAQLDNGCERIKQLEDENILGIEHTAMREQINALHATISWLREITPHPLYCIDFSRYSEVKAKYRFSWLGWL